jgi:amidase
MQKLWQLSATDMASGVASGAFSASDLIEAHLIRIEDTNPQYNAIVSCFPEDARRAAARADMQKASGESLGPLHGVPFTVKNNIDVAGSPTTYGIEAFAGAVPEANAPVVEKMLAAGAILIGRTNLPDMALRVDTDSSFHGRTVNPWNDSRTAGGSSGGDAVALAMGMTAIGLGNDIGGSLRSPASACGIASIKPSAGRVADAGTFPAPDRLLVGQLMNSQGPMARSIGDVRLALQVLMGSHPRDPWAIDAPFRGPTEQGPIKVAVIANPPGGSTDPVIANAVLAAADALANAGYAVEEMAPPRYEEVVEAAAQWLMADYDPHLEALMQIMGRDSVTFLKAYRDAALPVRNAAEFSGIFEKRDSLARAWSLFMADYPLILSPTWARLPFELGFDIDSRAGSLATRELIRPVMPANILGLPSACVPAAFDAESGLPIGVLLTGRRFREDMCLDAAEVVERVANIKTPLG